MRQNLPSSTTREAALRGGLFAFALALTGPAKKADRAGVSVPTRPGAPRLVAHSALIVMPVITRRRPDSTPSTERIDSIGIDPQTLVQSGRTRNEHIELESDLRFRVELCLTHSLFAVIGQN